jgi:alpha-L-arabinofuranosidase
MSNLGRGTVLQTKVDSPTYETTYYDPRGTSELRFPLPAVPYLKVSVVHNYDEDCVTIFALNRSLDANLSMKALVRGFDGLKVRGAHQLRSDDLMAVNTKDAPDTIKPSPLEGVEIRGEQVQARLAPASWNVIRLEVQKQ